MPARRLLPAAVALTLLLTVTACTKSTPTVTTTTTITTTTTTTPPVGPTGPVSTGPVSETTAASCPYISYDQARSDAGYRLDRISTLSQDGKVVGCRFYPSQYLATSEHLPPPSQVAIEILANDYAGHTAAFNAMVLLARSGTNPQQYSPASGNTGICYQATFWSADNGKDWECAFTKNATLVTIKTVVTDPALNVISIAQTIYPKF